MENDVGGALFEIMDLRALASAKERIDSAPKGQTPTDSAARRYLRLHLASVGRELGIKTS